MEKHTKVNVLDAKICSGSNFASNWKSPMWVIKCKDLYNQEIYTAIACYSGCAWRKQDEYHCNSEPWQKGEDVFVFIFDTKTKYRPNCETDGKTWIKKI